MKLLVTGGSGFIGNAVIRHLLVDTEHQVVNVDRLTYAAVPEALSDCDGSRLAQSQTDVCDPAGLREVFARERPDSVLHLAAESHVDRSIHVPATFVRTNIVGTHTLLEVARDYWCELPPDRARRFRYVQVSTDEVFGSRDGTDHADENSTYAPSSPYAGSKAAADQLAWSYCRTWGMPVIVTHSCNNYGPWQHPDKLVPVVIVNALERQPIPVYGNGNNIRDWLHVDDHARALLQVIERAAPGTAWGISANAERTNLELVHALCSAVDQLTGMHEARASRDLIRFVRDRPGHDRRYGLASDRIRDEFGWRPQVELATGIAETAAWYHAHLGWCRARLRAGDATATVQ